MSAIISPSGSERQEWGEKLAHEANDRVAQVMGEVGGGGWVREKTEF